MKSSQLIISILTVFWIKGVCLSKEKPVFQTPRDVLWRPNDEVKLSLTHEIQSYDTILWYQRSAGDTSLKLIAYIWYKQVTVEPAFENRFNVSGDGAKTAHLHLLKLSPPADSGEYFGAASFGQFYTEPAYFGRGTKLTVLETNQPITPPTVTLLPPSQHECYNQKDKEKKKTLVCVASAFYPDHVSVFWSMNGHNVTTGVATDDRALRNGAHYSLTSRLRVPATTWFTPANRFTCTVSFFNGTDSSHHSDDVAGSPGGEETMTREKYLRITQSAKLSYVVLMVKSLIYGAFVVFLVWKLQGSTGKHN